MRGWLAAVVLLAGCVRLPDPDAAVRRPAATSAGDPVPPFRFDWKPPCAVPVTERVELPGRTAIFGYDIAVAKTADPELYEVRMEHLRPLELNGQDAADPAVAAQVGPLLAATSVMPVLRVSREGRFVDVTGEREMVERLLEVAGARDGTPAAMRLREWMLSPQTLATMRQRAGDYWQAWVGAWIGLRLGPGDVLDGVEELAIPGGSLRAPVRYRHDGMRPDAPALARIVRVSTLAGPEIEAFMTSVLTDLAHATGKRVDRDLVRSARRTTTITADTDPTSLKPRHTTFEVETELEVKGDPSRTQRQRREATFDWARARGCR